MEIYVQKAKAKNIIIHEIICIDLQISSDDNVVPAFFRMWDFAWAGIGIPAPPSEILKDGKALSEYIRKHNASGWLVCYCFPAAVREKDQISFDPNVLMTSVAHAISLEEVFGKIFENVDEYHRCLMEESGYVAIGKYKEAREMVATLIELMERSDMENFGEDCKPVTNREWFSAIERAKAAIS